jgi:hypothetical protein
LRIGYLGQARCEKGFDRLAAILRQFEALHLRPGPNVATFLRSAPSFMLQDLKKWCVSSKKPRKVSALSLN